jgi:hypothetical protein
MPKPTNYEEFVDYRSRRAALGRERAARERRHLARFNLPRDADPDQDPIDVHIERTLYAFDMERHEVEDVSAPISSTYLHPDPDRRALIDAWLREKNLGAAA